MKLVLMAGAVAGLLASGLAWSADESALARSKNCLSCHAIDKKLVGPAYQDVADAYRGNAKAPAMLAAKVKAGGVNVWGKIPMPPNNVSEEEAKRLVAWVLALPPRKK